MFAARGNKMDATYHLNGGFKPTTKRFADLDGPDFYPTPRWATYALIDNEPLKGEIWECACGDGAMSEVLAETGNRIERSDLFNGGYGEIGHDFLTTTRRLRNIITNPPYNSAEGFVATGLRQAQGKFALLLRLAFLEGANRANTISTSARPAAFGCSASGLPFIPRTSSGPGEAPRLTRGSFGTKITAARRNLHGSSPDTGSVTGDELPA
jgi:hypothetical protein